MCRPPQNLPRLTPHLSSPMRVSKLPRLGRARANWATLLAKALEGKNVKDLLSNVGAGGGAPAVGAPVAAAAGGAAAVEAPKEEEKKEEAKEESDDDMGFGLFD
ncbi:60s acidic ribosomal protein-domain-containing protein [Suillus placidus]|uniref:60s acidic ribosomal protein-domain-containing protein n=1 Tax=Suillus placidus TaxID=48579 RepID=A0A9P6ZID4_9AGAM|nr:60s acidic ribosomal protein-domain-containing protein [Suillus placidus]